MKGKLQADFIGIVCYRISRDRPGTFLATWYSTRTDEPALGTGVARGDTSRGFCGVHQIRYHEPDGAPAGTGEPYELTIVPQGEARELTWRRHGAVAYRGIGIESGDQLVASYWRPSEA